MLAATASVAAFATSVVSYPGRLEVILRDVEVDNTLTITGEMDARDFVALREMKECPDTLDLSGARIIAVALNGEIWGGRTAFASDYLPDYILMQTGFKQVSLPAGLLSIGMGAFTESAIEKIVLPEGLTTIGDYAFRRCKSLKEMVLPSTVTKVGKQAFAEATSLTFLSMEGSSITEIPEGLAAGATSLTTVGIPPTVATIGPVAFSGTLLRSIDAEGAEGEPFALAGMKRLVYSSLRNSAEAMYLGDGLLRDVRTKVTTIPDAMFAGCVTIDPDNILDNVVLIGDYSFTDGQVSRLTLPRSLVAIGNCAFSGMNNLEVIDVRELGSSVPDVTEHTFDGLEQENILLLTAFQTATTWLSNPYWGKFEINVETDVETPTSEALALSYSGGVVNLRCSEPMTNVEIYSASGKVLGLAAPNAEEANVKVGTDGNVLVAVVETASHRYVRKLMIGE